MNQDELLKKYLKALDLDHTQYLAFVRSMSADEMIMLRNRLQNMKVQKPGGIVMKLLFLIVLALGFTACSQSGSGASNNQARALVSVDTFHACNALSAWDKTTDLEISPTAGAYDGTVFHSNGTTPYITLKGDGKAYLDEEYTVNGTLPALIEGAQFNMNDCTLTIDANGSLTVTAATAPNDQI